jgi:hypothetical protein
MLAAGCAAPPPPGSPPPEGLVGPTWRLESLSGEATELYAIATFGSDGISGTTTCWAYAGPAGSAAALRIRPLRFNFGACEDRSQDDPYFRALIAAERLTVAEGRLVLLDAGGAELAGFRAE